MNLGSSDRLSQAAIIAVSRLAIPGRGRFRAGVGWVCLLVVPSLIIPAGVSLAVPRFAAETVRLDIGAKTFTVEGSYLFLSRDAGATFPVLYPFPADTTLGEPEVEGLWISCDGGPEEEVRFIPREDGLLFWLPFDTADSCRVRVVYAQTILGNRVVYPLVRTREWGEPLSSAEFVVILPEADIRPTFSYPFVPGEARARRKTFYLRRTSFMPDRNLIIHWEPPCPREGPDAPVH
jgi:hypothetical protein